jgi:hypothetical protein
VAVKSQPLHLNRSNITAPIQQFKEQIEHKKLIIAFHWQKSKGYKFPRASAALSFDLKIGVTKQSIGLLKCKQSLILNF